MTSAPRWVASIALGAVALVSCAMIGPGGTSAQPAEIYAAGPTVSDVRALFGDDNWWQGPPSFQVRPLDAETTSFTQRFSVAQRFLRIGTAEEFVVQYTVFDKTSSATTRMTGLQQALGASPSSPKVGDQVLYYGLPGSGGAPYITRTFVRVGQIVVSIIWARKDPTTTVQQLGRIAVKVVGGLKKATSARVRETPAAVDQKLLPPPGLDITFLGAAPLPVEAWLVMVNIGIPTAGLKLLHDAGVTDFAYGDYALNNDTHMEVRSALLTFATATAAADWASTWSSGTPDQSNIASAYVPTAGVEGSGEYHYFFTAGTFGGMLVCKSSIEGEAASRACEGPMERTAIGWKFALGG
ncbi:MAG TPA: hypothetical protein VNO87_10820 [Methylomirabilota bacterium]|nr:hypothetical protein [Methylomirabilota bacterium]